MKAKKTGFIFHADEQRFSKRKWTIYLFLEHVKIVDDDSDEQVKSKEGAAHDKDDKIDVGV